MMDKQVSNKIKRHIANELTHFLILNGKAPSSIRIDVMYEESVAQLNIDTKNISKYFGEEVEKSNGNDI